MSEMASWFKSKDGFIFLTDDDVIAFHENNGNPSKSIIWDDFVGHSGLMTVFKLPNKYDHLEGFAHMPTVIRKAILDGKMDKLFAHAGNLMEATPEFIPLMKRLASRSRNVADQLRNNPYRDYNGSGFISNADQMKVGVKNKFRGSTIGNLLRHDTCDEKSMMIALQGAQELMDEHTDHHHYHNIINHQNVTRAVLKYITTNIKHKDVLLGVSNRLKTLRVRRRNMVKSAADYSKLKVKTISRGKAKIRAIA